MRRALLSDTKIDVVVESVLGSEEVLFIFEALSFAERVLEALVASPSLSLHRSHIFQCILARPVQDKSPLFCSAFIA